MHEFTPHEYVETRNLAMNALFTMPNETCVAFGNETSSSICINADLSVSAFQGFVMEHLVTIVFVLLVLQVTDPEVTDFQWSVYINLVKNKTENAV